jgi:hypothetical protein
LIEKDFGVWGYLMSQNSQNPRDLLLKNQGYKNSRVTSNEGMNCSEKLPTVKVLTA